MARVRIVVIIVAYLISLVSVYFTQVLLRIKSSKINEIIIGYHPMESSNTTCNARISQ